MSEKPYITNVYHWPNGMTMVFDQFGQQMSDYQGPTEEVSEKIERDRPKEGVSVERPASWPR